MTDKRMGVAIIGCGNIAGAYARDLKTYPFLELLGASDIDSGRAETFAEEHQIAAYPSAEALLADPRVDLVVNLTSHFAHKDVSMRCFDAGKHVYSEKPLATSYPDAAALVEAAKARGVRLGCSPFTLMGEAQQTAWKQIRDGALGKVRVVYAEVNWGRIESWHPAPAPFYEVGALWDVGVYPLTILVSIFGAVKRVQSHGTLVYPNRVTQEGVPFTIMTPDFAVTMLDMADGTVVRLTTNFYVGHHSKQSGLEFHGDLASMAMQSWGDFDSPLEIAPFGGEYAPLPLIREPAKGIPWGRGIADMAESILENRPHRFTGELAAHVTEILDASSASMKTGMPVEVRSTFTPPAPMEWSG